MRTTLAYITSTFLIAFLSVQCAQAQTEATNTGASNGNQIKRAEFRFTTLLAQPRASRRVGFNLMPAFSRVITKGSVFSIALTPALSPNQTVFGTGTVGRLTRWNGFNNGQSLIGDSSIFENNNGLVGIGTDTPTSKLTVMGLIESTGAGGGIKFPDGTIQSTAAIGSIFHDASLTGNGTAVSPLGIAASGVNTIHLANASIVAPKLANGTVVRSLNGLFDNLSILPGSNITVTPGMGTLTIAATGLLSSVVHGATLTGSGTSASPLNVANAGIGTPQLASNAVTSSKIASGQVVKNLNGLFDSVTLAAGSNISITPLGNTLTIASTASGLTSVAHGFTLTGNGSPGSPLNVSNGGIGALQLAGNSVTAPKIASGQVVKSLNGLFDNVTLAAGSNISITPLGNTVTIASSGLSSVSRNATLTGNGTAAAPLGVNVPLHLSAPIGPVIKATSTGIGSSGVEGYGGPGGPGVIGVGGFNSGAIGGGPGVNSKGGGSDTGVGGAGAVGAGGNSNTNRGGIGVFAQGGKSNSNVGGDGVMAQAGNLFSGTPGRAGVFEGAVQVNGSLNVTGTKNFMIDHPLDPENKYLYHAAIESSEVLNIYSGNVRLDANGEAMVTLPEWFEALNKDFRYSLTPIGAPAQGLYIAEEVSHNQFKIAGGLSGAKVSWQVTGIRSDAAMRLQPFKMEEDKPEFERGYFLTPQAYDQPEERGVEWARQPELMRKAKQQQLEAEQTPKPKIDP